MSSNTEFPEKSTFREASTDDFKQNNTSSISTPLLTIAAQKTDHMADAIIKKDKLSPVQIIQPKTSIPSPATPFQKTELNQSLPKEFVSFKEEITPDKVLDKSIQDIAKNLNESFYDESDIEQDQFISIVSELLAKDRDQALKGLAYFVEHIPVESLSKVINTLSRIFREIEDYVSAELIKCDGVRIILDYLNNKGAIRINCTVCDHYESLSDQLLEISKMETFTGSLIVRCCSEKDAYPDIHYAPIHIKKIKNDFQLVITDSVASEKKTYHLEIAKLIKKTLPSATVYAYGEPRQTDLTNCSIFSIRDVVEVAKNSKPLWELTKKSKPYKSESDDSLSGLMIFNQLPPSMMKTTQSISKLEVYKSDKEVLQQSDEKEMSNLTKTLQKYTKTNESSGKPINSYAQSRFGKYAAKIVSRVFLMKVSKTST